MKYASLSLLFALFLLPASLVGQNILLDEDFSGNFPPSAWTEDNNGNSAGWTGSGGMAYHDDYTGWNDNALISPGLDSSGLTNLALHFIQDQVYASWRDSNTVEISLDGGLTWQTVYDETGSNSTSGEQIDVSLAAYLGQTNISLAFHYTGDYANEWAVDDVVVDDAGSGGGGGLNYEVTNLVSGGLALFHVDGAIPGSIITMAYSLVGPGPVSTPVGLVDLSYPIKVLSTTPADSTGEVLNLFMMPSGIAGLSVWTQALSEGPAGPELTNSLALVVQ